MRRRLGTLLALALLLGGCGDARAPGPPEILYGQDICDRCRMVISEERHAAAARLDGAARRFDDPGCLRAFLEEAPAGASTPAWVHDESGSWLALDEAWLVVDPEGRTPMGSGIVAFGARESAAAAAQRYGSEPLRWPQIPAR